MLFNTHIRPIFLNLDVILILNNIRSRGSIMYENDTSKSALNAVSGKKFSDKGYRSFKDML